MYKELIEQLSDNYIIKNYKESFNNLTISVETSSLLKPSIESIKKFIDKISIRDNIRFKILDGQYPFAQYSNGSSIEEFISDIEEGITGNCENSYKINIEIVKNIVANELSVYDFKLFLQYIKEQSLQGILFEFNRILINNYIIFKLQNGNIHFASNSIFFTTEGEVINVNITERKNQLNRRMEICNFLNSSEYSLLASDFEFYNNDNINTEEFLSLKNIMNKVKNILAIIGICDISTINGKNKIKAILNGYKRIECLINYENEFSITVEQYYKINQWIYDGGNLSDKVGIARNMISLYINDNNLLALEKNTLDSIKSSYEIYLKENINKYLQLRVSINESVIELINNLEGLIDELVGTIFKFILGGLSVIFTIVVMNSIYSGNLVEVITGDLAIICIGAVIILNIILLCLVIPSIKDKLVRYEKQFISMKESYRFMINSEDLDRMFDQDKFNEKKEEFTKGLNKYMKIWYAIQIVLAAIIFIA